ncbi:phytanoyl-CoA dioxygenase family protein [uncultured Aquimarina sp.]|uniref:phytanoyl-CoA dioxygenase family protein n=1 Tax=uncultured Aquimarina sp. TaxID=575652 RepID=UPI002609476E|nr:phytanoyl-CoA dioxygenase family protein [uncultured Aquimarina sp.]
MRTIFKDPKLQLEFEDKGYVVIDFLNLEEVTQLKEIYKELNGQPIQMGFSTSNMSMDADYRKMVSNTITSVFSRAVNEYFDRFKLFFGIFTSKQPNQERSICSIHQDPTYVDESKYQGITVWVPLIDTNETNGALEVMDKSYLLNEYPRSTLPRFPYNDLASLLLKKYFKRLDIKAGQAYIGNSKVFHWSPSNMSNEERVAALAWMAEEESQMRCYYQDFKNPGKTMEVFELEADHYIENPLFSRPDESKAKKIGEVDSQFEPLNEAKIDAIINGVTV